MNGFSIKENNLIYIFAEECCTEVIRDVNREFKYLEDNVLLELFERCLNS